MRGLYALATVVSPFICWIMLALAMKAIGAAPSLADGGLGAIACPPAPEAMFDRNALIDLTALCGAFLDQPMFGARDLSGRLELATAAGLIVLVSGAAMAWSVLIVLTAPMALYGRGSRIIAYALRAVWVATPLIVVEMFYLSGQFEYIHARSVLSEQLIALAQADGRLSVWVPPPAWWAEAWLSTFGPAEREAGAAVATGDLLFALRRTAYFFGYVAVGMLIATAAVLVAPRQAEGIEDLRWRFQQLQTMFALGSLIFVLSVALMRGLTLWGPRLLDPEMAEHFIAAASSTVTFWGASGSAILIAAAGPAFFGLSRHIDAAARRQIGSETASVRQIAQWREEHGLSFTEQGSLVAGLILIAPLIAGPLLDATTKLAG